MNGFDLAALLNGLPENVILSQRAEFIDMVRKMKGRDTVIVNSYQTEEPKDGNVPLKYLAKSLELLADADMAFFGDGWNKTRGCMIEHICCVRYGIPIIYD